MNWISEVFIISEVTLLIFQNNSSLFYCSYNVDLIFNILFLYGTATPNTEAMYSNRNMGYFTCMSMLHNRNRFISNQGIVDSNISAYLRPI